MNIINSVVGKLGGNQMGGGSGRLQVQVVEARNLARKDLFCMWIYCILFSYSSSNFYTAKSDPYCVLSVVSKHSISMLTNSQRTTTINNNQNPVWNQTFTLPVSNSESELLKIKVWDNDPMSFDDEIGNLQLHHHYFLNYFFSCNVIVSLLFILTKL